MPDMTQRLCTNHNCQISFVSWFPLHGWCPGCDSCRQVLVCCVQLS